MPMHDWQFWFVSALALCGFWILLRPFIRRSLTPADAESGACPSCPTSGSKPRGQRRRVALTIERKRV
jgi:hypothetical protein